MNEVTVVGCHYCTVIILSVLIGVYYDGNDDNDGWMGGCIDGWMDGWIDAANNSIL